MCYILCVSVMCIGVWTFCHGILFQIQKLCFTYICFWILQILRIQRYGKLNFLCNCKFKNFQINLFSSSAKTGLSFTVVWYSLVWLNYFPWMEYTLKFVVCFLFVFYYYIFCFQVELWVITVIFEANIFGSIF